VQLILLRGLCQEEDENVVDTLLCTTEGVDGMLKELNSTIPLLDGNVHQSANDLGGIKFFDVRHEDLEGLFWFMLH